MRRPPTGSTPDPIPASCTPAAASTSPRRGRRTPACSLTDDEHRFLTSSRAKAEREASARARRRRALVGVLGVGLVVDHRRSEASRSPSGPRPRAKRTRPGPETWPARPSWRSAEDPERAVMLALTAMHTTHTPLPEAVSALQAATQADRVRDHRRTVSGPRPSPRGPTARSSPSTDRMRRASRSSTPPPAR